MRFSFLLVPLLCLIAAAPAWAFDADDAGTFALVHKDGHVVADFLMRLHHDGTRWQVEQREPDGTWVNITCETDCILEETSAAEAVSFAASTPLAGQAVECVHNHAFALCRNNVAPDARRYSLLALINDLRIPMQFVRVDPTTFAPVQTPLPPQP